MKFRTMMVAVGAAFVVGACGGDGGVTSGTPAGDDAAGSGSASLAMTDNAFSPAELTVSAGPVEMVNDGQILHNLSVEGTDFDHDVKAGETETEDLGLEAGTYTMFCKYHRAQGMEGTLTITA